MSEAKILPPEERGNLHGEGAEAMFHRYPDVEKFLALRLPGLPAIAYGTRDEIRALVQKKFPQGNEKFEGYPIEAFITVDGPASLREIFAGLEKIRQEEKDQQAE